MELLMKDSALNGKLPEFLARRVEPHDRGHGSPCLEWIGALHVGYAWVSHEGKPQLGHRLSYEYAVGPIPAGLVIDHLCRNRKCINPDHLDPVTQAVNVRRAHPNYSTDDMSVCPHGHPLTEGWYYTQGTSRVCVRCIRGDNARPYRGPVKDRTECPQGHPYSGDNLYITPKGSKVCRRCRNEKGKAAKRRVAA